MNTLIALTFWLGVWGAYRKWGGKGRFIGGLIGAAGGLFSAAVLIGVAGAFA